MNTSRNYVPGHIPGHKPDEEIIDPSLVEAQTRSDETIELISKYDHMFDAHLIKVKYFKKLRKIYKLYGERIFHNNYYCNEMLLHENIELIKNSTQKSTTHFLMVEVVEENGEDILIVKRKKPDDCVIKVLSAEKCFSVILKAHRESMHGNGEAIRNITEYYYKYPLFCIPLVIQSCNVCKEVSKSYNVLECKQIETNKSVWKLAIQKMHNTSKFQYIFVYIEDVTAYTLIRPLTRLSVEELGMELLKIFSIFGSPKKILTTRDYEYLVMKTLNIMVAMDPKYMYIQVDRCQDYKFDVALVLRLMKKWSIQTGSKALSTACSLVQWQLNTSLRVISPRTSGCQMTSGIPYNLFFGSEANAFNHFHGDLVAEQLNSTSRNPITLEIGSTRSSKVTDQIAVLSSDESDDESSACCVCNEEFCLYSCRTCRKPVHYKCGSKIVQGNISSRITHSKIKCNNC